MKFCRSEEKYRQRACRNCFDEQKGKVIRLGELILERGLVDKSALIEASRRCLRRRLSGLLHRSMREERSAGDFRNASPSDLAVLPIRTENSTLIVAMAEPQNLAVIDELGSSREKTFLHGSRFVPKFWRQLPETMG